MAKKLKVHKAWSSQKNTGAILYITEEIILPRDITNDATTLEDEGKRIAQFLWDNLPATTVGYFNRAWEDIWNGRNK